MATSPIASLRRRFGDLRRQLSYLEALPQLTILGTLAGVIAAGVIIAFRFAMDAPLELWLGSADGFESLTPAQRFLLPALGATLIGVILQLLPDRILSVGVGHVLDRLHNHQGHLQWPNFLVQFFAGITLLVSGQSVGREGPAVHLGAGAGSLLGQAMKIPNNSLRVMVAAGVAAAIAAAFNTPLAGVVFAMEVVLMEYTIAGFLPIIMASFAGSLLSRLAFGTDPVFSVQSVSLANFTELPYLLLAGVVIGSIAALYTRLLTLGKLFGNTPIALKLSAAGIVTGLVAMSVPQVLGMGYDTLALAMSGGLDINLLLLIIAAKIVTTGFSISAGMPGGLIGPTLFIGGLVGAALGVGSQLLHAGDTSNPGFYVLLGMTAMLGAVLNAPLTALLTILELTNNSDTIFPSMLVVVISCLCTRIFIGGKGVFLVLLKQQGRPIKSSGLTSELSRVGVFKVASSDFVRSRFTTDYNKARALLETKPRWVVLAQLDCPKLLIRASDLAHYLENAPEPVLALEEEIDLREVPGQQIVLPPIHEQATLLEAHLLMKAESTEAVYVQNPRPFALNTEVMGIVTREAVTDYYSV